MSERTLVRNTTFFTGALMIQKMMSFAYFWFVSNRIAPHELGQYVFALSFTTLFSIIVDVGLSPVLTREASKSQERANQLLQNVIGLKIPLAVISLLLAWLTISFSGKSLTVQLLVLVASGIMVFDSFTLSFWVVFRAHRLMVYESIATIGVQVLIFGLGVTALVMTGSIIALMVVLLIASISNFFFAAFLLKKKLHFTLRPRWHPEIIRYFIAAVPAFTLAGIFVKIYNTADSVLLGYLAGEVAVGFYAIPAKIVYAFQQIIPAAFAAVIFPAFSFYHKHDRQQLIATFIKAFRYLLLTSVPLAAGLALLANPLIALLWPRYLPVIPTFISMSLAIPFIFITFATGYLLNAVDLQNRNTLHRGIITVIAVILNVVLIPRWSYFGSGVAFLISNILLFGLDWSAVSSTLGLRWRLVAPISIQVGIATAGLIGAIEGLLLLHLHVIIVGLLASLVYGAVLYAVAGFRIADFYSPRRAT